MIYSRMFGLDVLKAMVYSISVISIMLLALLCIRYDGSQSFVSEIISLLRVTLGQTGVLFAISCFNFTYYSWLKDWRLVTTKVSGTPVSKLMAPALVMCLAIALLMNAMLPPRSLGSAAHIVEDSKLTIIFRDNQYDYSWIEIDKRRPGLSSISTISASRLLKSRSFLKNKFPLSHNLPFTVMFFVLCTIYNISRQSQSLHCNSLGLFALPVVFVFTNTCANRILASYPQIAVSAAALVLIVFYTLVLQYAKLLNAKG